MQAFRRGLSPLVTCMEMRREREASLVGEAWLQNQVGGGLQTWGAAAELGVGQVPVYSHLGQGSCGRRASRRQEVSLEGRVRCRNPKGHPALLGGEGGCRAVGEGFRGLGAREGTWRARPVQWEGEAGRPLPYPGYGVGGVTCCPSGEWLLPRVRF